MDEPAVVGDTDRFEIDIAADVLDDLRARLRATRWPDAVTGGGWTYGTDPTYLRELTRTWAEDFDWAEEQRRLNTYPHQRVRIGDVHVHYVHLRADTGADPQPLLLLHGWPSSFVEMLPLADRLANPRQHGFDTDQGFDVIVPSLPGYLFSDRPDWPGFNYRDIARLLVHLMSHLGYDRFGVHAYDVGATTMGWLLDDQPERVIGYHTTDPGNPAAYVGPGVAPLTAEEAAYFELAESWELDEGGYMALQTTRPQTLGYGLNDSPAGMAAWVIEKWRSWTTSASGGDLEDSFSRHQLLTMLTLYWATETINPANRLYFERAKHPPRVSPDRRIDVPLGVSLTSQPIERVPRSLVARLFTDIRLWRDLNIGGHFIALEQPDLVAASILEFFGSLHE